MPTPFQQATFGVMTPSDMHWAYNGWIRESDGDRTRGDHLVKHMPVCVRNMHDLMHGAVRMPQVAGGARSRLGSRLGGVSRGAHICAQDLIYKILTFEGSPVLFLSTNDTSYQEARASHLVSFEYFRSLIMLPIKTKNDWAAASSSEDITDSNAS